ncbi:hypothetical protein PRNP1_010003 [Phytophthora ramorum]
MFTCTFCCCVFLRRLRQQQQHPMAINRRMIHPPAIPAMRPTLTLDELDEPLPSVVVVPLESKNVLLVVVVLPPVVVVPPPLEDVLAALTVELPTPFVADPPEFE